MTQGSHIRYFEGGVSLITGGASGIGKALAEDLAKRGCEVVIADLQEEAGKKVAADIVKNGGKARNVVLDVTDFQAFKKVVEDVLRESDRIDTLFNNAGIAVIGLAENYEVTDWDCVTDVNLRGVTNGIQAVYRPMIEQGFGHIINTASVAGLLPAPVMVGYAATKHAVVGLSKALRIEAERHGVRVTAVCPGIIRTPILSGGKYGRLGKELTEEQAKQLLEKHQPLAPEDFVPKVIRRIVKNHGTIVEPSEWRFAAFVNRLFPSFANYMSRREFRRVTATMNKSKTPNAPKATTSPPATL
ncbi:MAG: SDR family NAD(P)-dependent oxidoreductase [Planctomycetota bacterium]|nr:SDR family NAD(P)-dependent oxidoreductase [Planctomycetota bacterium]